MKIRGSIVSLALLAMASLALADDMGNMKMDAGGGGLADKAFTASRSEEHTSELQSPC